MSTAFGGLSADPGFRFGESESDGGTIEDASASSWPEEMEMRFYAESSVTLPGRGSKGTNCGVWGPQDFCDECGDVGWGPSRCEQRGCPNCWWAWSGNRTEKGVKRLAAARHAADEGLDKRAVHCVASPPEGEVRTLADIDDGFREAYQLAKERGVRGGVCIFHGFRVKEGVQDEFERVDPDGGIWRWIRERDEDWRRLTYWSPHWHILGMSRDVQADEGRESDVWRFQRIDRQGGRSAFLPFRLTDEAAYSEMAGTFRYLLSHLTFESDSSKDSVRWFGTLATAKFSPDEELSDGALNTIERYVEEVVGSDDVEADGECENGECEDEECEECGARSRSPIWEAGSALMDREWCDRIGRKQQRRLSAAFEWAIGERKPPPGLARPSTREECEETFEAILNGLGTRNPV